MQGKQRKFFLHQHFLNFCQWVKRDSRKKVLNFQFDFFFDFMDQGHLIFKKM